MATEVSLIRRLEAADVLELAQLLAGATGSEEQALREYLGEERFQRMRERAVRTRLTRAKRSVHGNVVVIHGIMGAELCAQRGAEQETLWISLPRIVLGALDRLQLDSDGVTETHLGTGAVRATAILKKYYGELLLCLAEDWVVRPFFFDWRKSLDLAAAELNESIIRWFGHGVPVHLVAHSMGGLVARTLIANHRDTWNRMWDEPGAGQRGGRLLMLGTPNHGSFAIPQMVTGLEPLLRKLAIVDLRHDLAALKRVFSTFPGPLQMLPSPFVYGSLRPLYNAKTYEPFAISQTHLTAALDHHAKLRSVVDPDRMSYVAGCKRPTLSYVEPTLEAMSNLKAYAVTSDGDGRVPHALGLLDKVATYYLDVDHGGLASNPRAFPLIQDLLEHGKSEGASARRATTKRPSEKESKAMLDEIIARNEREESELSTRAVHHGRHALDPEHAVPTSADWRAEELVLRGLLGEESGDVAKGSRRAQGRGGPPGSGAKPKTQSARISIRVVPGSIADFVRGPRGPLAPDALAAGHYPGVPPQAATRDLDALVSSALGSETLRGSSPHKGVLAQFAARGILRGRLGELFFLNLDPPRPSAGKSRLVCILGLGEPGRLGVAELTVAVRELCWALDRLGRCHLATVLIGAGPGNLSIPEAVNAWVRGMRRALTERPARSHAALSTLTFIEWDPERIEPLAKAFETELQRERAQGLAIELKVPSQAAIERWKKKRRLLGRSGQGAEGGAPSAQSNGMPATVVIVSQDKEGYLFAAMTEKASIPERKVAADHALVMEANQRLAGAADPVEQGRLACFLHQLIVPESLRPHLCSPAPLVMVVDATTARIHWEMLADAGADGESSASFLGTSRGLTRRLRTEFAPPPEPTTAPERELRVLVVADPAEEMRLPGAALEGFEVAKLFESFNHIHARSGHRVVVTRLIGPEEATRLKVLMALTQQHYDVLHFAGHCVFDPNDPSGSGWIFSGGTRLTARELNRIDRIPRFVFSNACESGITPERASARAKAAAPSFAEAFFARGVSNFVCSAWEVDDDAALAFAIRLYRELLGLQASEARFLTMAEALQKARTELWSGSGGIRTWGAYQHYGTPTYRFFDNERRRS